MAGSDGGRQERLDSSRAASDAVKGAWGPFLLQVFEIFTSVAMGILYFAVLTPVGLVMRLAGRDSLRLRFQPQAPSYWIPRAELGGRQTSMAKQS